MTMTPTETIRTALADLWDTGANAYELAQAVMKAADLESPDLEIEVESVISRALLAREFVDLSKVAAEVAKVLPSATSETCEPGPVALTLYEALLKAARGMRLESSETATRTDIAYLDGHNAALAEMEAEIVKRFAALSVEEVAAALLSVEIPDGFDRNGSHSSGTYQEYTWSLRQYLRPQDEWKATELAQAVLRLLRKE